MLTAKNLKREFSELRKKIIYILLTNRCSMATSQKVAHGYFTALLDRSETGNHPSRLADAFVKVVNQAKNPRRTFKLSNERGEHTSSFEVPVKNDPGRAEVVLHFVSSEDDLIIVMLTVFCHQSWFQKLLGNLGIYWASYRLTGDIFRRKVGGFLETIENEDFTTNDQQVAIQKILNFLKKDFY